VNLLNMLGVDQKSMEKMIEELSKFDQLMKAITGALIKIEKNTAELLEVTKEVRDLLKEGKK